jgi:hypothetical protein
MWRATGSDQKTESLREIVMTLLFLQEIYMNQCKEAELFGMTDAEFARLCQERIARQKYYVLLYWTNRRKQKEGFISTASYAHEALRDVRDLISLEFDNFDEAQEYLVSCIENHGYVWADNVDDEE